MVSRSLLRSAPMKSTMTFEMDAIFGKNAKETAGNPCRIEVIRKKLERTPESRTCNFDEGVRHLGA